jgi:hypothetical protein
MVKALETTLTQRPPLERSSGRRRSVRANGPTKFVASVPS